MNEFTYQSLNEIKLYLQKVKDICKSNDDFCRGCPFAIENKGASPVCALGDVPEVWLIDKMKGNN